MPVEEAGGVECGTRGKQGRGSQGGLGRLEEEWERESEGKYEIGKKGSRPGGAGRGMSRPGL